MSLVQKVESGYLQFLRIVFLLFATIAIVAAAILSVQFLAGRNAAPIQVNTKIELKSEGFELGLMSKPKALSNTNNKSSIEVKDELLEKFLSVIETNGKTFFSEFSLNREFATKYFYEIDRDSSLGRSFLIQLVPTMDKMYKSPSFKPKSAEFGKETDDMIEYFKADYRGQADSIRTAERIAESNAALTQSSARTALIAAAGGFGIFVLLILLVVLLKIERNLRQNPLPRNMPADL